MTASYIPPKFRAHTSRRDTLPRPRLVDRAIGGDPVTARVTLVVGPAGYGKTTLLSEVAARLIVDGWRTAWVNCDAADREPDTFLETIARALQVARPGFRIPLQSIDDFAAALHAAPLNLALFIDEYENAACAALDSTLEQLARAASENIMIFVAARSVAQGRFLQLELDGTVRLVSATELRFDDAEAQQYLGDGAGDATLSLVRQVEGWPFALQLARLNALAGTGSVRASAHPPMPRRAPELPREKVFAFLAAEVMTSLGDELATFIVEMSLLRAFGVAEAEAVTHCADSGAMMRRLETLVPIVLLSHEPLELRFHPLFQDYLQSLLYGKGRAAVSELQRRIAVHYAGTGRVPAAVRHAVDGGLLDLAAALVEDAGATRYIIAHGVTQARNLLHLLPPDLVRSRLRLRLMSIGCLADSERGSESSLQLAAIEEQIARGDFAEQYTTEARLDLEVARAIVSFVRIEHVVESPDWKSLQQTTMRVQELFADDPGMWIVPMVTEARLRLRQGSLARAEVLVQDLIDLNEQGHDLLGVLDAALHRALWALGLGDLDTAASMAGSVLGKCLNLYGHEGSHEGQMGNAILGQVLYLRGDVESAVHHFRLLEAHRPSVQFDVYTARYVWSALCDMAAGQPLAALERLEQGTAVARERQLPHLLSMVAAAYVDIAVAMGDIPRARATFERYSLSADFEASVTGDAIAWPARLWLTRGTVSLAVAEGRPVFALESALRFEEVARQSERRILRAAGSLICARAQVCLGEQTLAREAVERALALTVDTGAARPFLEFGPEIVGLVRQHARSGAQSTSRWAAQIVDNNACLELLTARQRDILEQLALRRTTKEIARDLGLSPETVKHHLKIIFERLGVSSRDEAVNTARQRRRSAG